MNKFLSATAIILALFSATTLCQARNISGHQQDLVFEIMQS
jgi:hypothetical protein